MHIKLNSYSESKRESNKNNHMYSKIVHNSFKQYKFSILLAIEDMLFLEKSVESIIKQSIGFENIELILVDELCNEDSKRICFKYQEKYSNIRVYFDGNKNHSGLFKKLIKDITGKYLNFFTSDVILEINALSEIYDFFEKNFEKIDFISIPVVFFEEDFNTHVLNDKTSSNIIIDLIEKPNYNFNLFSSLFFKTELLYDVNFDSRLNLIDDLHFFQKFLTKNHRFGKISSTKCYCRNTSYVLNEYNKKYHINKFKIYFEEFFYNLNIESKNLDFLKYWVLYKIQLVFNINNNLNFFSLDELNILKQYLYKILQVIDDDIIFYQETSDKNLKYSMLIFKHDKIDTLVNKERNTVEKFVNGNRIDGLDYHWIYVDSIEISNNFLYILGFLRSYFNSSEIKIQALKFDKTLFLFKWEIFFNCNKLLFLKKEFLNDLGVFTQKQLEDCLKKDKCNMFSKECGNHSFQCSPYLKDLFFENYDDCNIDFDDKFSIDLIKNKFLSMDCANKKQYYAIYNLFLEYFIDVYAEIYNADEILYPLRERKYLDLTYISFFNYELKVPLTDSENSIILIRVIYDSFKFYLKINFQDYAKLSSESFYSNKDQKYLIKFENNYFYISNFSITKLLNFEKSNIDYLESSIKSNPKLIDFRKLYYFSYFMFFGKRIWLFMDRLDFAGDNAECLYRYAIAQNDGIEKYFIISEESDDYQRLKNLDNIVIAGSNQHKLLSCHAEKIISSQIDDEFINPFYGENEKLYNGLFSPKIYFLQHGITLHDVSSWLHKYDKFVYLIVTASKFEYDSFFKNNVQYNYDKSVVQLLGFPRYDNLIKLEDTHEVVIMPTWRRYLHKMSEKNFKKSSFYKYYNALINDEKLISFLEKQGYKLVFKPHYNLNNFIHLFDKNPHVDFDNSRSYADVFNHASLIITDFSSVAFDFAYLKKPVIYYHFKDKYHFDTDSYFKYDSMGFGEIVKNNDDLVNLIIRYVNSNCEMKQEYKNRVDRFFAFKDKKNCKRVYEFILNHGCDFMNHDDNGNFDVSGVYDENLALNSEINELKEILNEWGDIAYNYSGIISKQKQEIISLEKSVENLTNENSKLKKLEQEIISLEKSVENLANENSKLSNENSILTNENSELKKIEQDIFSSNSWKFTKIFRDARNLIKNK